MFSILSFFFLLTIYVNVPTQQSEEFDFLAILTHEGQDKCKRMESNRVFTKTNSNTQRKGYFLTWSHALTPMSYNLTRILTLYLEIIPDSTG